MSENWKRGVRISWYLLGPLLLYALVYDFVVLAWSGGMADLIPVIRWIPDYVTAGLAGVFVLGFWFGRERIVFVNRNTGKSRWFMLVPAAAMSCILFNHLLALLGIPSEGYDAVKHVIFGREIIWQMIGPGFFIPLAEEFVFRGLGYGRLRREMDVLPAVVITALLFGLYHGNLIQGIYACCMGLMLAFVLEVYGNLSASWLFHATANLTAIGLTNTPIGMWFVQHRHAMIITTILGTMILCGFCLKLREDIN